MKLTVEQSEVKVPLPLTLLVLLLIVVITAGLGWAARFIPWSPWITTPLAVLAGSIIGGTIAALVGKRLHRKAQQAAAAGA